MKSQIMEFRTPQRFKGRTGLQIFVDRFYREGAPPEPMEGRELKDTNNPIPNWQPDENGVYQNNYFYGGNFRGIIAKLDYIKANGFDMLYLSPFGLSNTSHHYEPEDQLQVDPWIGTWEDFQLLSEEAHKRDILIAVDLVFNHMGVTSPIFQNALSSSNSRYHDWFEWNQDGTPVYWAGLDNMPQCNKYNPEYQEYTCHVAVHYIKMGADAIRLDLGENFPPVFMRKFRKAVKEANPEVLIVNEAWGFDNHREFPQLDGTQADSLMNYPLADAIFRWVRYGNAAHFQYNFGEILKYPKQAQEVLWNFLDSHDTPRATNLLAAERILEDPYQGACWDIEGPWRHPGWFDTYGFRKWEFEHDSVNKREAFERLALASTIQYFVPGIPMVFAGTEVGATGYKDPFNRKPYPWNNPDEKILEHYRYLGEFRRKHRQFFSEAGNIQIDVSKESLKITRRNSFGEMTLYVVRNTEERKAAWGFYVA